MADPKPWEAFSRPSPAPADTSSDKPWEAFGGKTSVEPSDGALVRGFKKAGQSMAISTNLALGDSQAAAAGIKRASDYATANPGSAESRELMQAWERGEGFTGGLSEVGSEIAKDWRETGGFLPKVKSAAKNVGAVGETITEQVGNMAAPLAAMGAGTAVGAKVGAAAGGAAGAVAAGVGAAPGAAIGGTVGGIAGGVGGAAIANAAQETGYMAREAISEAGIDPADGEAVRAYLDENAGKLLKRGATKGAILAAVDRLTMGLGSRLLRGPAQGATNRALTSMGVDVADRAAVKAAMETPQFAAQIANDTAFQTSRQGAQKIARNAAAFAVDPTGEFAGEYLGTGMATGEWDTKSAGLEAILGLGQSGIMYAGQKGYEHLTSPLRRKLEAFADDSDSTMQPPVGDAGRTPAPRPVADASRAALLDGAPQPLASSQHQPADLETAVAQQLFRTEVDDTNPDVLRFHRYDRDLQRWDPVPEAEARTAAQTRIREAEQFGEDPLNPRATDQLWPDVQMDSGPLAIESVKTSPAAGADAEGLLHRGAERAQPLSVQMGLDPNYGPISAAAALAVDSGAAAVTQPGRLPLPDVQMDSGPQVAEQLQAAPVVGDPEFEFSLQSNGQPFRSERDFRLLKVMREAERAGLQSAAVQYGDGWAVVTRRPAPLAAGDQTQLATSAGASEPAPAVAARSGSTENRAMSITYPSAISANAARRQLSSPADYTVAKIGERQFRLQRRVDLSDVGAARSETYGLPPAPTGPDGLLQQGEGAYFAGPPLEDYPDGPQPQDGSADGAAARSSLADRRRAGVLRWRALGISREIERGETAALVGRSIRSAGELAELAQVYRDPRHEVTRFFFTKGDTIVHASAVTARLPGSTPMFPGTLNHDEGVRWLTDQMTGAGADGYWLLHNHPSGDPTPSDADIQATRRLYVEASGFKGHVVINSNKYTVITGGGHSRVIEKDFGPDLLLRASQPSAYLGRAVASDQDVAVVGKSFQSEGWVTLIGASGEAGVRAVADISASQFAKPVLARAAIRRFARQSGSSQVFAYGRESDLVAANTPDLLHDGFLTDAVNTGGHSHLRIHGRNGSRKVFGKDWHEGRVLAEREAQPRRRTKLEATIGRLTGRRRPDANDPFAEENRRLREQDRTLWKRAKQEFRRQFAPGGLLPTPVFDEKVRRDSEFQAVEFDVRHLVGGLEKAVKADYGRPMDAMTEAQLAPLGEALAGKVPDDLPDSTKTAVLALRQYIDALSGEYVGILQQRVRDNLKDADPALIETITSNIGAYVHRSYRAFDDPKWFQKVPTGVINAARRHLAVGYQAQGETAAEAERLADVTVNELLKSGTAYDSMESFIAEGKLGAKDLGVLTKRKQIAPEIRALLGEYTDPRLNFAKSATKMGRLIWNQRFLDRVREIGMGALLFEGKNRPAAATAQIAGEQSEAYAPLNGLWTFPEVAQAFKDALGNEQMGDLYRMIVRLNGMVKYGKTVLSPTTAMRNWQSAMFFSLANGHFDLLQMRKSLAAFREQVAQNASGSDLAYLRKLKQLGVVYDTPYAGEMMRLLEDARLEELLSGKSGVGVKWLHKINQVAQGFYAFGDDFWKIVGFENEKAGLLKAGIAAEQAEQMAAERIRNTYPTYSMVGRGINWLRRFPLAGTFVSFPAEIVRTSVNMLQLTAADLKSDNPGLRALGRKRAAGMAMVSAGFYALAALTAAALGVDDDEEEALRDLAPPWQKNSTFLFTGRDADGKLRYFDLSFLDPYGYWKRPLTAMLRDQPWEKAAASALGDMLSPFLGADITAGALFEVMANKKGSGGKVYLEHGGAVAQTVAITDHLRKALQPGFVSNAERLWLAGQGARREGSGQPYEMRDEVVSLLGWRASTLDTRTALYYRSFEFTDALIDARKVLTRTLRSSNQVSDADIHDARDTAQRQYEQAFREMTRLVQSARASGMNNLQIAQTLRLSGISKANTVALLSGQLPPMTIGTQSLRRAVQQAELMQGSEHAAEVARRFNVDRQGVK